LAAAICEAHSSNGLHQVFRLKVPWLSLKVPWLLLKGFAEPHCIYQRALAKKVATSSGSRGKGGRPNARER